MSTASSFDYDVIVIGAGPAGSSAATRTAAAGLKTLIVEKEHFPRFRIGESLLPHGNALLRETGVWSKIEAAGFIKKYGASFHMADGSADKEVIFSTAIVSGLEQTYQVERAKFDAILLDHARENGAEVRLGQTVREVSTDSAGHRVSIETPAQLATDSTSHIPVPPAAPATQITARFVIDSSGRDQFYPSELKRVLDPSPFPKRVAIYNHFHHVARAPGMAAGHTVIVRLEDGWFWIIPIDDERTSVGLVTTTESMRKAALSPEEFFNRVVASSSKLTELMAGSTPVLRYHVTSDYSYFRENLATERLILTGDAAGFFDPIFSSGVYMACYSAKLASDLVIRAHKANRTLTTSERANYTSIIKKHAGVFQKLIGAFYDNSSFSVFMCPKPPMGLAPAITAIVAGHAKMTWPIWWRFKIFLLVCRLQRKFPLVPALDFAPKANAASTNNRATSPSDASPASA